MFGEQTPEGPTVSKVSSRPFLPARNLGRSKLFFRIGLAVGGEIEIGRSSLRFIADEGQCQPSI